MKPEFLYVNYSEFLIVQKMFEKKKSAEFPLNTVSKMFMGSRVQLAAAGASGAISQLHLLSHRCPWSAEFGHSHQCQALPSLSQAFLI